MNIHFWIFNFSLFLVRFLSAIILLKPKLTAKNVAIGLGTLVIQMVAFWVFFMFIHPSIKYSFFGEFWIDYWYYIWGVLGYFIAMLILFALYKYSKDLLYSYYCLLIAVLFDNISFLVVYSSMRLFEITASTIWTQHLFDGFVRLLGIAIVIASTRFFAKFPFFVENRTFIRRFCLIAISFEIFSIFILPSLNVSFNILMVISIAAIAIFAFWQQRDFYKKEIEKQRAQYVGEIEMQHFAIRSFRHDYINVLLTMDQYIKEDDMVGLKQYFNNEIMPTRTLLENQDIELGNLGKLQSKEIKSLLSMKIMEAQSLGISTIVEIPEVVKKINMKPVSLARVLGVFLDNAIEACKELEASWLGVAISEKKGDQIIVVKNTCDDRVPTAKQMFKKGFSTKGASRGLGLYNVRQLLDKEPHAALVTVVEGGYFVQELRIKCTSVNAVLLDFN